MVKFEELDRKDWEQFRMGTKSHLSALEFQLVCELHSKYYKHSFFKPCTCSPKTIKKWIKDLNVIWENGNKEN